MPPEDTTWVEQLKVGDTVVTYGRYDRRPSTEIVSSITRTLVRTDNDYVEWHRIGRLQGSVRGRGYDRIHQITDAVQATARRFVLFDRATHVKWSKIPLPALEAIVAILDALPKE